jgi:hypothetical protein
VDLGARNNSPVAIQQSFDQARCSTSGRRIRPVSAVSSVSSVVNRSVNHEDTEDLEKLKILPRLQIVVPTPTYANRPSQNTCDSDSLCIDESGYYADDHHDHDSEFELGCEQTAGAGLFLF